MSCQKSLRTSGSPPLQFAARDKEFFYRFTEGQQHCSRHLHILVGGYVFIDQSPLAGADCQHISCKLAVFFCGKAHIVKHIPGLDIKEWLWVKGVPVIALHRKIHLIEQLLRCIGKAVC